MPDQVIFLQVVIVGELTQKLLIGAVRIDRQLALQQIRQDALEPERIQTVLLTKGQQFRQPLGGELLFQQPFLTLIVLLLQFLQSSEPLQ